jgi:putative oxidoreductase
MGVVAGGAELAGGALLIVGLFTPLAAAAILGLLANVIVLKWQLGFFEPGYELELVLSGAAFALLFAGPGRASLDRPTPWFRRPGLNGFIFLIIGAAAAVVVLLVLRHHN